MKAKRFPRFTWIVILVLFIFFVFAIIHNSSDVVGDKKFLKNILEMAVPLGESFFFLDTLSFFQETGKIEIQPRAACAIESAARWHPLRPIFMLYTTQGHIKFEDTPSDKYIELLSMYHNIHFGYINVEEYGKGTPLETIITKKTIELSEFKVSHTSDMLRVLTLWKYGGIYLDTDVMILKSFDELAENFIAVESSQSAACGVLRFNHTGVGHDYLSSVMRMFAENYDYKSWAGNGPALYSELAKRVCKVDKVEETVGKKCEKLNIYPQEYFYPVFYPSWRLYFQEEYAQKVEEMSKNSYAIHVWNKLSSAERININSTAAYLNLARRNCPRVISAVQDYF